MFINNVTKIVFRNNDFIIVTKEKKIRTDFINKSTFSPRYGYSRKFERSIYTFYYKNISAFYLIYNEFKHFIVIELSGREAYFIDVASEKQGNYYLNELKTKLKDWNLK